MTLLADMEDRSIEAPPARRTRAIASGQGPRAPWLASAVGGVLALALLSAAAAPMAVGAQAWLKQSMQVDGGAGLAPAGLLVPALVAASVVIAATLAAHALTQGAWIRLSGWRRPTRSSIVQRAKSAAAGWVVGIAALAGGIAGAMPWLGALPELARRPLDEGVWAVAAFVASAALGALIATVVLGFVQLRLAMRAFDRTLRMTHAEAREAARDDAPAARRRPVAASRWRLA